jgi:hypothetical protein
MCVGRLAGCFGLGFFMPVALITDRATWIWSFFMEASTHRSEGRASSLLVKGLTMRLCGTNRVGAAGDHLISYVLERRKAGGESHGARVLLGSIIADLLLAGRFLGAGRVGRLIEFGRVQRFWKPAELAAVGELDWLQLASEAMATRSSRPTSLKEVNRTIRLEDFQLSSRLATSLTQRKGRPALGLHGIREALELPVSVPLLGSILKPSRLLSLAERCKQAWLLASRGLNLIKEDETYIQPNEVVIREAAEIQRHISDHPALYVPNISACHISEDFVAELGQSGVRIVMVNVMPCGWSWLTQLMALAPCLGIWVHRVGYQNVAATLGMRAVLRALRLAGADLVHIGTPWLYRQRDLDEAKARADILSGLDSDQPGIVPVLTKTTIQTVPRLIECLGVDICLMACGAFRQSGLIHRHLIDAWVATVRSMEATI